MATITYKCPNCGGGLKFEPKLQKYKCEFCLSTFTQEELDKLNPDSASDREVSAEEAEYLRGSGKDESATGAGFRDSDGMREDKAAQMPSGTAAGEEQADEQQGAVVYTCPSCGASVITDANTAATFCYYCHSPIVLEGKLSGKYLPDRVIPFKFDKKQAEERFIDYVGHKHFVPKSFFSKDQIEKLSGVYYPFWAYDCMIGGSLSASGNKIRSWVSGDTEFTETNVYHVERSGKISIQNLSRNALSESDKNLIDAVMPFLLNESEEFSMGYLQGFVAQKRDIESDQIAGEMEERAQRYAEAALDDTIRGYTTVTGKTSSFHTEQENYSYLLLPVWLLTYKAKDGKKFYFAMNGQTGETHGKLPVDYGKLSLVSAIVAGIVFSIVLAILYFLM